MAHGELVDTWAARGPKHVPAGNLLKFSILSTPKSRRGNSRNSHSKVKTGCRTCKLRHVKCDETKPICSRCQTFGVKCEGYPVSKEYQTSTTIPARDLLPKTFLYQADVPSLRYPPLEPIFTNEHDYYYYVLYRDKISSILSGGFDSSLWDRIVLQACDAEPCLRQLIISLAALYKETSTVDARHLQGTCARVKYGKALKGIRESLSGRQDAARGRIALVAALLIFCFESQLGDPALAVAQIQSALGLLRNQLSTRRSSYRHLRNISPTADLEYELVSVFTRLDSQILARVENVDPTRTYILDMTFFPEEFDTPEAFTAMTEARNYLEHLQFRACPSVPHDFVLDFSKSPKTWDDYLENHENSPGDSSCFQFLSAQLGQWNKSFRPLFERSRTPAGSKDFLAATILRIHSVSVDLLLRATRLAGNDSRKKDLSGQAREIVDLTKRAISHPDFRKAFVFEVGFLPSLMCVFLISNDRDIKVEIIGMLRSIAPRREMCWDSVYLADFGERLLASEDQGLEIRQ